MVFYKKTLISLLVTTALIQLSSHISTHSTSWGLFGKSIPHTTISHGTENPELKVVVFDFGGILTNISHLSVFRQIGVLDTLLYTVLTRENIYTRLFDTIDAIPNIETSSHRLDSLAAQPMHNDKPLPEILCQQLENRTANGDPFTTDEALSQILEHIKNIKSPGGSYQRFINALEQRLLNRLCNFVFDPTIHSQACTILTKGLEIAEDCKRNGVLVLGCTTYELETLKNILKRFPELAAVFNVEFDQDGKVASLGNIIASGDIGIAKPDPRVFTTLEQRLLTNKGLSLENCLFIDDRIENIESAVDLGMSGIHCPDQDFKTVRQLLTSKGLLPEKTQLGRVQQQWFPSW